MSLGSFFHLQEFLFANIFTVLSKPEKYSFVIYLRCKMWLIELLGIKMYSNCKSEEVCSNHEVEYIGCCFSCFVINYSYPCILLLALFGNRRRKKQLSGDGNCAIKQEDWSDNHLKPIYSTHFNFFVTLKLTHAWIPDHLTKRFF